MENIMNIWSTLGSWGNVIFLVLEIIIVFGMVVVAEKLFKKEGLIAWVAIATVLANIITNKSAEFFGLSAACGTVVFASVFLATDILSEKYTKDDAKKAIHIALASNIALILITQILIHYMPSSSDFAHDAMTVLFSGSLRISIASTIMFYVANLLDVYLFNKLKAKMKGKHMWIRNNISTVVCNCVENFFFFNTLGLDDNFTKIGIKPEDFPAMAKKACLGGVIKGFKPLAQADIEKIYEMCI